ncbi:MAG TPA: glycosyltransferase family 1 protein [Candidatus Nanoarchaeia archaeon]
MKVAIDTRFLGSEGSGVGKYTQKLVENLLDLDPINEYFIILRKSNWHLFDPKKANFQKVLADAPWYGLKEQFLLPAILAKIKPDLVHFPHFNIPLIYPGKFVVTIHDIITSEFKGAASTTKVLPIYLLKHFGYELTIAQALKRAEKIIVPSNFIKKKLCKNFHLPSNRIVATYEAADECFMQAGKKDFPSGRINQVLATYGVHKPFILYVGAAHPHKNLDVLLSALKFLSKNLSLVYSSPRSAFVDRLVDKAKKLEVEDRLVVSGFVPNEDLAVLYKQAECLVFPSLSEGFGLPGLEAMAAGCPVVCSNIPVFREVYGEAAVYFDPRKPEDIAEKIKFIVHNSEFRGSMIQKGKEQVKKYSWQRLAEETLSVYKFILRNPN